MRAGSASACAPQSRPKLASSLDRTAQQQLGRYAKLLHQGPDELRRKFRALWEVGGDASLRRKVTLAGQVLLRRNSSSLMSTFWALFDVRFAARVGPS